MSELYKRGTVWWNDAHHSEGSQDVPEIVRGHQPLLLAKTGWIVRDDEIGVTIGYEFAPRDERNAGNIVYDFRGFGFVPRACIVRVEYLDPMKGGGEE